MKKLFTYIVTIILLCCATSCGNKKAKYVFYFIGDGMSFQAVCMAEAYQSMHNGDPIGRTPLCFSSFPASGIVTTYSADENITDSSAAGTALSTGEKTNNHMLCIGPDSTTHFTSIAKKIHDAGYKVGIMTTVPLNHATPAAFYAHSIDRNDYYSISCEIPESGFEFLGGGPVYQPTGRRGGEKNSYEMFEEAGYSIANGQSSYESLANKEKVIVFSDTTNRRGGNLVYRSNAKASDLSLANLVADAIEVLENEKGFFMMAEGGQIDMACHSNDLKNAIFETIGMDEAVQIAYAFYQKHPDETLIVITADHETGGLSLGRKGYNFDLSPIDEPGATERPVYTAENYMSKDKASIEEVVTLSERCRIGWTTKDHAGSFVPVFAVGVGSESFVGRQDNTDIPKKICAAMGVEF